MEITSLISKKRFTYNITTKFLNLFFLLIRKICKLYPVNKGSIVIVALHRLGDSVFTIPAIKHIQNHYKSKVTIVCFPHSLPIFQIGLRDVEYCPLESNNFYFDKRVAGLKNKKIFKKIKPKIIYDLTGVMSSASLILTSRAKEINGMSREQFKYIFDNHVLIRNKAHQIDVYLDAISSNIQISKRDKLIQFPVNYNKEDRILIHPLAGWKAKQWGLRKYLMLAKKLKEKYEVYLIAPKNTYQFEIKTTCEFNAVDLIETESVNELIEQIKKCSILIGNDSGPIQIAGLLGKLTFTLYGSTNPDFHLPIGKNHSFASVPLKCSPKAEDKLCFTHGGLYGCPSYECMNLLSVDAVYNKISSFLSKVNN